MKIVKQIWKEQKSTDLLLKMAPFARLVREIMQDICPNVTRIQLPAVNALQEAAEAYLIDLLECKHFQRPYTPEPNSNTTL